MIKFAIAIAKITIIKMSVKNVKVKNIRQEGYDNLKKWMEDKNNIYIGRKGIVFIDGKRFPTTDSLFANPYKIDENNTRNDVILKYEVYIHDLLKNNEQLKHILLSMHNKNLGCWCKPEQCHGDILIKIINECIMCEQICEK